MLKKDCDECREKEKAAKAAKAAKGGWLQRLRSRSRV